MCGIAGIAGKNLVNKKIQEKISLVGRMLGEIAYRGPDGSRIVSNSDGTILFGMSTLSIIPSAYGLGPFQNNKKTLMITYNGEVYNYDKLGKKWKVPNLKQRTDTEVVLKGYEIEGPDFVKQLNGMFAFAIADIPNQKVLLYRDRLGEKPLYYRIYKGNLVFGSEVKAILLQAKAKKHLSHEFLAFETPIGKQTLFEDIHLLEPGTYLVYDIKSGGVTKNKYWALEKNVSCSHQRNKDLEEFSLLLRTAVKKRIPKIPFALLLSGGLDSSILAYLMRPKLVFTVRYPGLERFDESQNAKLVAKEIGAKHIFIEPNAQEFRNHIGIIIRQLDYPLGNSSTFSEYMVYKKMAELGIKVAIDGIGMDELALGYVRHALMIEGPNTLEKFLKKSYHPLIQVFKERTNKKMTSAEKYFQLVRRGPILSKRPESYFYKLFKKGKTLGQSLTQVDLGISFPPLLLTSDKLSSAFGIEKRSPYLDHKLVEFIYGLEDKKKISGGYTKVLLREFAKKIGVPKKLYNSRDKVGFSTPIASFLSGELYCWFGHKVKDFKKQNEIKHLFNYKSDRGMFDRTKFQQLCVSIWAKGEI